MLIQEILHLRPALAKLEAKKKRCLADKEKADREIKEAEADYKFRARKQEFGDLLNINKPSFCSGSCDEIHATTNLSNITSLKHS